MVFSESVFSESSIAFRIISGSFLYSNQIYSDSFELHTNYVSV